MIEVWIVSKDIKIKGYLNALDIETNRQLLDIMNENKKLKVYLNNGSWIKCPRSKIEVIERIPPRLEHIP